MVDSWCNMEGRGVVWDCHGVYGCSVVDGGSMVSNGVVGCSSVVDNCMVRVCVSHHRRWDYVAVLVQDGFWEVGVEQGVCIQTVEGDGRATVHCVPELAPEQVLIEERPVGADETSSLRSVPSVVANAIR